MEPIPETVEAIRNYGPFLVEDEDLLVELADKVEQVLAVVPECVGVTLASNRDGVAFTVAASEVELAVLDGVQYVDGGPCVEAVDAEEVVQYEAALDETQWQAFASATAALGVASTLTLPVVADGVVTGSVNLYASAPGAFTDHHDQLADVFGAWAPGAVTDADLAFSTRAVAEQAPRQLQESIDIQVATGLIATQRGVDQSVAHDTLVDAALRAGVTEAALAWTIVDLARMQDSD